MFEWLDYLIEQKAANSKPVGQLLLCSFSARSFEENEFFSMHNIDSFKGKGLGFIDISFF